MPKSNRSKTVENSEHFDVDSFDSDILGLDGPRSLRDGSEARRGVMGWDDPFITDIYSVRQADWQDVDIAFIGGPRLHEGLLPLCNPIPITRSNWKLVRDRVRPILLIVESFLKSFDGHWHLDQFHTVDRTDQKREGSLPAIVAAFRDLGIPTVFWNTLDVAYSDLIGRTADAFDLSFFSDGRYLDTSNCLGTHLPPACSPALHTPLDASYPCSKAPPVLFDGWADILRYRESLSFLEALQPDGLAVVDSRYRLYRNQLDATGPLADAVLGCVTRPSLWAVTKRARARIFSNRTISAPHSQHWDIVEAAACGVGLFMHGKPAVGGALDGQFPEYERSADLVEDLRAHLDNPMAYLPVGQKAWRRAVGEESFAHRMQTISERLGLDLSFLERPKVTVLSATFRLQFLERILQQFDAQTYPDKELALVVNSDKISAADVAAKIGARDDVRIAVVPAERVEAGSLNHGIRIAEGEYIVKMDDDDLYGSNYLSDMILHARSHDLDLFGKANRFIYFSDLDKTFARQHKRSRAQVESRDLLEAHIGGATLSGKTAFFRANPYPEGNFSATDTHYYANLQGRVDGRFAMLDDTGFVYWRRAAAEHSWKIDNAQMLAQMDFVSEGVPNSILEANS